MHVNALRGHFAELGIVVPQGAHNARQLIAILEDDERYITQAVRIALGPLVTTLIEIEGQIAKLDKAILAAHRNDDVSLRLSTIPGIGPSSPLVFPPACRTQSCLRTGESLQPGWALFPDSIQQVESQGWAPFPKWATDACASFRWSGHMPRFTG